MYQNEFDTRTNWMIELSFELLHKEVHG